MFKWKWKSCKNHHFNVYNSAASVHSFHCAVITVIQFQNTSIVPKGNPVLIRQQAHALATTTLLSVSMDVPTLDISSQWKYTKCGLLGPASFTQLNVFKLQASSMLPHGS